MSEGGSGAPGRVEPGTSPESIAAMTGVPAKAVERVRSDWGAIFGLE